MKLTDEILMAYADGLLAPSQQAEIERLCAEDPLLRARLRVFHATGRELGRLFQNHVDAPVPRRLLEFVKAQERRQGDAKQRRRAPLWSHLQEYVSGWRFASMTALGTVAVASAAMIIGFGLGGLLLGNRDGQETVLTSLVEADKSQLIARAPLRQALDTLRSGTATKLALTRSQDVLLKIKMTFRDETRAYCRVYEMTTSSLERYSGVACRTDDQWSVRIQAMIPPSDASSNQFVPAGMSNAVMDAVVRTFIDEGPFSASDEDAALGKRWEK